MNESAAKELRHHILFAEQQIAEARKQQTARLQEWAHAAATLSVGDKFTQDGYPHHGKTCEIVALKGRLNWTGAPAIEYTAAAVKKDGALSAMTFTFYGSE